MTEEENKVADETLMKLNLLQKKMNDSSFKDTFKKSEADNENLEVIDCG